MLEPEVQKILQHIENEKNFLLSGGAGSGKTYSLVQVIKEYFRLYPHLNIACMTYTNAAAREVAERVDHPNLHVSTIHDFFWSIIKSFQSELSQLVVEMHNDQEFKALRYTGSDISLEDLQENGIQYKEYVSARNGIISHDEVIAVAHGMFGRYRKLSDITKSKFPLILIDEYQDTDPKIVEIFLNFLTQSNRSNVVGFFGDSMQSIYDKTVGNLSSWIQDGIIEQVWKEQNRRNPQSIIDIANALRDDGLEQRPSHDLSAPNMEEGVVKDGVVRFVYTENGNTSLDAIKTALGWDFTDTEQIKELNLTHNLIAPRAGFETLMAVYDKDKIYDYRKRIRDFIKKNSIENDFSTMTFGEVVAYLKTIATDLSKVEPTPGQRDFIEQNSHLMEAANQVNFASFSKLYVDKEQLIDDKKDNENAIGSQSTTRDALIKHLFGIQSAIHHYAQEEMHDFLRMTEFKIRSREDKRDLLEKIETLKGMGDQTIENVLDYADKSGIRRRDDRLNEFSESKKYLYDRVKTVKYSEFLNLYEYLEGRTPFSTQHKVKGNQFDRVLVVLDNGGWSHYNFNYLFEGAGTPSVLSRTRKIFYVCCTRAKEELVVFYNQPTAGVLQQAREWFGETNVIPAEDFLR